MKQEEIDRIEKKLEPVIKSITGGRTKFQKAMDIIFPIVIIGAFTLAIFAKGIFRSTSLEIGLLLLSLKFILFSRNEVRINHYNFWILESLESRLIDLIQDVKTIKRHIGRSVEEKK